MITEKRDRLREAAQLYSIHAERMSFAREKVKKHFPLDKEKYTLLQPEEFRGLNLSNNHYQLIMKIWKQVESYIKTRFKI